MVSEKMGATHSTEAAVSLITPHTVAESPPGEYPQQQKGPTSSHHQVAMQGVGGGVARCPVREGNAPDQSMQGWVSECPASVGQEGQADFDPRNMVRICAYISV